MPIAQDNSSLVARLGWLRVVCGLIVLALGLKLWHLAVVQGDHYAELALRNHVRNQPLVAPRGAIYDRDGRVLVENTSAFNLFLYLDEAGDPEATRAFLTGPLAIEPDFLSERIEEGASYSRYQPVLVRENLSMEELALVLSHQTEHPELRVMQQPRRLYRHGKVAAHIFGFVGEVSREELAGREFESARPGDIVGKVGLERVRNRRLTGVDGQLRVLVNSAGKTLAELERARPVPGGELHLTLDLDLQLVAERELEQRPGAALVFDPRSGEVLVLASRPSFDPNLFASRITGRQWRELIENPDHPLQNRVIQSAFSPGSIFKLVMALAGLELGLVDADDSVYCNGGVTLYGHPFRCWNPGGHGRVNVVEAIQHSCNVYFYLLGQRMGIERIAEFSHRLGLGHPTGIDLLGEVTGIVPSEQWKRATTGQPWYAGETISVAIGQGALNVTPAQLARAVGGVATGMLPELRLVRGERPPPLSLGFDPAHLELVREGMWRGVNESGTGSAARVEGFDVCGKTGTAQTISRKGLARLPEQERARFEPNAWFVGFAPRHDPEIVVAVIVQRGGSGGQGAAPIGGRILQAYFDKHRPRPDAAEMAAR